MVCELEFVLSVNISTCYLFLDKVVPPVSVDSVAYVYHRPIEEDSDAESLIDEFWGLDIDEESESEDEEDEAVDDEHEEEEELDVGDLPEDMNARCNLSTVIEKAIFNLLISFLKLSTMKFWRVYKEATKKTSRATTWFLKSTHLNTPIMLP